MVDLIARSTCECDLFGFANSKHVRDHIAIQNRCTSDFRLIRHQCLCWFRHGTANRVYRNLFSLFVYFTLQVAIMLILFVVWSRLKSLHNCNHQYLKITFVPISSQITTIQLPWQSIISCDFPN